MQCDEAAGSSTVVLIIGAHQVAIAVIRGDQRCDIAHANDILRMQLAVCRLGWSIRVDNMQPNLRELFDLIGVRRLGPVDQSGFDPGR